MPVNVDFKLTGLVASEGFPSSRSLLNNFRNEMIGSISACFPWLPTNEVEYTHRVKCVRPHPVTIASSAKKLERCARGGKQTGPTKLL